ncbi:tyrosine kinase receptor Cad96Ca-like [Patiria miniata]|uniref:receptor protein-tyrosine kinase n=1 Tax=Patiria miniata TaxID=46514 RepID=A0A913ZXV5_PATMI|nr:tyrosine kinase receptor Cad96Ca-like [Patiria miniata]
MASNTIWFTFLILGLFLPQCHLLGRKGKSGGRNSKGSCELHLTRNVSALVEGIPVQFTCSSGRYCKLGELIRLFLNGSRPIDEPIGNASSSNLSFVPDRSHSGLLLECRMHLDNVILPLIKNITLNVTFPPKRVAVSGSSMNCNQTCRAELTSWQSYEFKCQSVDSNPPCTFNWTLEDPAGRAPAITPENAISVVSKTLDAGWDATSSVRLEALLDYHRRILRCSVLHPNNLTVFREISLELRVNTVGIATIIIVGCSLVLLVALCILAYAAYIAAMYIHFVIARKRKKKRTITPPEPDQSSAVQGENDSPVEIEDSLPEHNAPNARRFERDRITFLHKLGEGAFGVVYKGLADGIIQEGKQETVAVKMLKAREPRSGEVSDFMKEVDICRTLEKHPFVIMTLGCCVEQEPYCLIFEYAPNGNLANFLKEKKREWRQKSHVAPISSNQIIKFACQIASGMHYLSSMKIVHRDLAARNILLGEDLICKVSDFGFSRDVIAEDFYKMSSSGAVPLRWMALESIVDNIYTSKSDVWSYGILLWEMVTMGVHPYPGIEVSDIIDALQNGRRLPKPSHCGDKLYTIMKECWHPTPTSRPNFDSILNNVDPMSKNPSKYLQMSKFTEEY